MLSNSTFSLSSLFPMSLISAMAFSTSDSRSRTSFHFSGDFVT